MYFRDPLNPSCELSLTATHGRLCHTGALKCLYVWQAVSITLHMPACALHTVQWGLLPVLSLNMSSLYVCGWACFVPGEGKGGGGPKSDDSIKTQFESGGWVHIWMRFSRMGLASHCQCQSRNSPGVRFDTVESERRQMKQWWMKYFKNPKDSFCKAYM